MSKYIIYKKSGTEKSIYCNDYKELLNNLAATFSKYYEPKGRIGLPIKDLFDTLNPSVRIALVKKLGYEVEEVSDPLDRAFIIIDEIKQQLNMVNEPISEKAVSILWKYSSTDNEFKEGIIKYLTA